MDSSEQKCKEITYIAAILHPAPYVRVSADAERAGCVREKPLV